MSDRPGRDVPKLEAPYVALPAGMPETVLVGEWLETL
jgi:hypothetical protein